MDDTVQNPVTTVSTTADLGHQNVFITLRFNGIDADPAAIHDMIDAQYGTCASVKGMPARGCYIYDIST